MKKIFVGETVGNCMSVQYIPSRVLRIFYNSVHLRSAGYNGLYDVCLLQMSERFGAAKSCVVCPLWVSLLTLGTAFRPCASPFKTLLTGHGDIDL